MNINPQIFREYDIRGYVDIDLSEEFAFLLGRAYALLAREDGKNNIAVGYDCRLSSEGYARSLSKGIASEGINVIFTGMGPTPQLYYSIHALNAGGGIQVTGSHNPSDMNGFKICLGQITLSGEAIGDLKRRMLALNGSKPSTKTHGSITIDSMNEAYTNALIERSREYMGSRKLKVVVDAGNGVGGIVGPAVLKALGVEVIELFCDPDGRFPNHHPDPTVLSNLVELIRVVKAEKADFGIGWDGDADRIGVVDENGTPIFGDMLLLICARKILEEEKGATIIGDVKCSSLLFDDVKAHGGDAIMWKTGHSLIKAKLRETHGALAGEMSGHIFFKHRYFGFDDALYTSNRLVEIMSSHKGTFSSLLSGLPKMVSTPEIRVECREEIKFEVAKRAQSAFPEYQTNTIDGVRVQFPNGWGLVRASNTQPVLVMRFEATSSSELESYRSIMVGRIEDIKNKLVEAGTVAVATTT